MEETGQKNNTHGVRYSIKETRNMKYVQQLKQIEAKRLNGSNSLYIGYTNPIVVQATSIQNHPFVMNQKDYRKSRREVANNKNYSKHAVPLNFFSTLPQKLNSIPLAIENGSKITLITDYPMVDTNGNNSFVILGVLKDQQMENDIVNQIKSVYPLDDMANQIIKSATESRLIIIDKKRAKDIFDTIGIQPSEVSRILDSNGSIPQSYEKSNTPDEKKSVDDTIADDREYMAAVERGDMETAQRMVDEAAKAAGYDLHLYHGSKSGGGFTVFKDWQYFTANQAYAERYTQHDTGKGMYNVYVKASRMFDTRNADDRDLFERYRSEYGMSELQDSGLPDWTDGYDLSEIIEENDLDYDGIVLDEGGDLVNGKPVSRGESYVSSTDFFPSMGLTSSDVCGILTLPLLVFMCEPLLIFEFEGTAP